jgi:hypothetical protein
MATRPGEIAPPTDETEREIFNRTGIALGREFAVMYDGERTGQIGLITCVSARRVTWRPKNDLADLHRESVATVSNDRVAWWIGP